MPVRNRMEMIARCIESLLAQDYPSDRMQLIIVDNASTDGTQGIVAGYPVTLLVEPRPTSYAARNRGIAAARGEIVAFLDSDCEAASDWLASLVAAFADDSVGAAVGTIADAPPRTICEELSVRMRPFARPVRHGLQTLLTANVAVRHSALEAVGAFDECLPTAGDVDLGWRIQRSLGLRVVEASGARVRHTHRSTFRAVFGQYRRYGRGEVLLTTLYHGEAGSVKPAEQRRRMLLQTRAIASYVASFVFRCVMWPWRRTARQDLLWPIFLLTAEAGNMMGKAEALMKTRGYRRNPWANPRNIERS